MSTGANGRPTKTNPRGIPEAPFIENVASLFADAGTEFQGVMAAFQERLQQYKYMEASKQLHLADIKGKMADIRKNISVIEHLQRSRDEPIETDFEVDSTLYTRAVVDTAGLESVFLWLGADVMLEYPLQEALELLGGRLGNNETEMGLVEEDLDFLRANITTMEVNTARLYNWDVEQRARPTS